MSSKQSSHGDIASQPASLSEVIGKRAEGRGARLRCMCRLTRKVMIRVGRKPRMLLHAISRPPSISLIQLRSWKMHGRGSDMQTH